MLASNAMQVFKHFGIYEEIAALGNHISEMRITDSNFKVLSNINLRPFEEQYGVHNVTIHRAVLQKKLIELVGKEHIFLGRKLQKLEVAGEGILADFGGEKVTSDMLIGADGIHSAVRNFVNPDPTIRRAYQKCWRGVTDFDLPEEYTNTAIEAWGSGSRFGLNKLNDKQVYWYALVNSKEMNETLDGFFDDFHPLAGEIINATKPSHIIESEITDLKPTKKWRKDNVCLIGDAAHATTPNMGQGACQAIEDALVLSDCISQEATAEQAFKVFNKRRLAKAHQVVSRSWTIGKVSQWENATMRNVRNFAMRLTPDTVSAKQLASVFNLKYN